MGIGRLEWKAYREVKSKVATEFGVHYREMLATVIIDGIDGLHTHVETKNEIIEIEPDTNSIGNGNLLIEFVKHTFSKDFFEKDAIIGPCDGHLDQIVTKHLAIFHLDIRKAVIGISLTFNLVGATNPRYGINHFETIHLVYDSIRYIILWWWHQDISTGNRFPFFVTSREKGYKTKETKEKRDFFHYV